MKKIFILAISIITVSVLVGCTGQRETNGTAANDSNTDADITHTAISDDSNIGTDITQAAITDATEDSSFTVFSATQEIISRANHQYYSELGGQVFAIITNRTLYDFNWLQIGTADFGEDLYIYNELYFIRNFAAGEVFVYSWDPSNTPRYAVRFRDSATDQWYTLRPTGGDGFVTVSLSVF